MFAHKLEGVCETRGSNSCMESFYDGSRVLLEDCLPNWTENTAIVREECNG